MHDLSPDPLHLNVASMSACSHLIVVHSKLFVRGKSCYAPCTVRPVISRRPARLLEAHLCCGPGVFRWWRLGSACHPDSARNRGPAQAQQGGSSPSHLCQVGQVARCPVTAASGGMERLEGCTMGPDKSFQMLIGYSRVVPCMIVKTMLNLGEVFCQLIARTTMCP